MRHAIWISVVLTAIGSPCGFAGQPQLPFKLMYVGNEETPRAAQFVEFLGTQFWLK